MVESVVRRPRIRHRSGRGDRRWRISLVSFDAGYHTVSLANALNTRCDVMLHTPATQLEGERDWVHPAVTVHELAHPRLRQPFRQASMLRELRQRTTDFAADVVHLQQGQLWFNLMLLAPRRTPLVVTVHDPSPHLGDAPSQKTPPWVAALPFARADHVIVHSTTVRERLVDGFEIDADRISVVPHLPPAVDPTATTPHTRRDDQPTILFFGRIWPYKGLDQLILAEPAIAAAVPQVRIVVAGEGQDWSEYAPLVTDPDRYDVRNRYVSDEERHELFLGADVVVLPYVDATQSGVVTLAQRYARPVVASAVGGLVEQVDHDRSGLLVPPGDPGALAAALVTMLTDVDLRNRLGAAGGRQLAADASVAAAQTMDAYASAIARSAP